MKKTVGLLIGLLHSAFSYEFSEQDRPLQLIFEKTLSNPDWVTFDPIDGRKQLYDAALASLNLTVDDTVIPPKIKGSKSRIIKSYAA